MSRGPGPGRGAQTVGLIGILLAAAALYAAFIARSAFRIAGITYFTLVDDAMISMRYAQHLAHGFGLVWNVGQPPVEGFTNPAWVLLMSLFHLLPLPSSKISLAVMVLSALILLANVLVVYRVCCLLHPGSAVAPYLAAGVTAFYFPLVFWALRGMEVGLLTLLIDCALLAALVMQQRQTGREILLFSVLLSLALLTRLDALLQVLILIGYLVVTRARRAAVLIPLLAVLLTLAAILAFQRVYFGDFLPNTYYQKMAGAAAGERIRNGLLVFYQYALWDTALPALVSLAALLFYKDFRRPETFLLAALFAAQCAYSVWVGGDYAEPELNAANRFITQGMPALLILFVLAADRILREPRLGLHGAALRSLAATIFALVALAVISGRPWWAWAHTNAPLLQADIRRTRIGLSLARNTDPRAVIAVHAAGQIPYYSQRTTIDLLGLNDRVIARGPVTGPFYPGHDKWNYEYSILQLRPDLIADNWIKLAAFMKDQPAYERLDNGMYLRRGTTLVNVPGLLKESR